MTVTMVHDNWTGTRGIMNSTLPDDWSEADMKLKEMSFDTKAEITLKFGVVVYTWAYGELGDDANNYSLNELAELWYAFVDWPAK